MKPRFYLWILLIITAVVFIRVVTQDFVVWDDDRQILVNTILFPISGENLAQIWFHPNQQLYIPLTYTIWMFICPLAQIAGHRAGVPSDYPNYDPKFFHTLNLLIHLTNISLVYLICLKISKKALPSLIGAAIFALHPMQVEPVAWVSELRGLLAGMFTFVAIYLHLDAQDKRTLDDQRWKKYEVFGLLSGLLGLLSKPSAVVLPLILLIIDLGFRKQTWKQTAPIIGLYTIFPMIIAIAMKSIQPVGSSIAAALWLRPFIVLDTLYFYAMKLVWPIGYAIDYGRSPSFVRQHILTVLLEGLLPLAIFMLAFINRRRLPFILLGLLIVWVNILPVSGIVPFIFQAYSTVADRYMYVGFLGVALITCSALPETLSLTGKVCCVIVISALAILTFTRVQIWDNTTTLMEASLKTNPNSWVEHNNLGLQYERDGRRDQALIEYQIATKCDPTQSKPSYSIGRIYAQEGNLLAACDQFKKTIPIDPTDTRAPNELGRTLTKLHRWEDAEAAYRIAIQENPDDPAPYYNIALIELGQGQYGIAEQDFNKSIAFDDSNPETHFDFARTLLLDHKIDEARSEYQRSVELGYADQVGLANLARSLGE